jgi:superfamily I DNA/RNA helicase
MEPQVTRVAISSDFFEAYAKLPQGIQQKVSKFLTNFQRNPAASGINYEKIQAAPDPQLRSVRIDEAWRGIVLKPEQGNLYLLLWVDRHDAAYDWASRHRCKINPATGAIQVFETLTVQEVPQDAGAQLLLPALPLALFTALSDRELTLLGVPAELIARVRGIRSEEELDQLQAALPAEAYEGLFLIAAGDTVDQILAERETRVDQSINTEDFTAALERVESQSRFVVVANETELAAVLNASLAQWRIFLHPSQRRLIQGVRSGPVRVLGGAGTGKTVVAMHRAKWLAEHWLPDNKKILFTTFTRNLAVDIQANLKELCSPHTLARIEVINLDAWVRRFLQQRHYDYTIIYGADEQLWGRALALKPTDVALPERFYREEWQRVVQPQGIETLDIYRRASRRGRGTTLSRSGRAKVWPVFEEYRSQLLIARRKEVDDAYRDAASLLVQSPGGLPYAAVIVDEAQDMGPQAFRLLRHVVPPGENDLFIVGDGHQRIYGRNKVILSKCGIDIRGRSRKLRVNYRTTEEIRRSAVALLEGCTVDDLEGGVDTQQGYKSLTHGEPPAHRHFPSAAEQADAIEQLIKTWLAEDTHAASICIVARTNAELEDIAGRLQVRAIATQQIRVEEADSGAATAVRLATMHRAKGLEFDRVIVASVNQELVPLQAASETEDPIERATHELEERALLYVALTRARKTARLLSYGQASEFLLGKMAACARA